MIINLRKILEEDYDETDCYKFISEESLNE